MCLDHILSPCTRPPSPLPGQAFNNAGGGITWRPAGYAHKVLQSLNFDPPVKMYFDDIRLQLTHDE